MLKKSLSIALLFCCLGCSSEPDRKQTYPVFGKVLVDGQPASNLAVRANPVGGMDQKEPTVSAAFTDEDGKFTFSTFENGDGIPEGQYRLTFVWGQMNMFSMQYGGPDKLKDRYKDAESSTFTIDVGPGGKEDLGTFDLTTK